MRKFNKFNGLNIRRGFYLDENQDIVEGIYSLKPKIVFKKGINEDGKGNVSIPIVFIGKYIHHIKMYTFEINVTLLTDEKRYIDNIDNIDAFNDIARELLKNFKKENANMKNIIFDQILKLQLYFTDIQNSDEFALKTSDKY